MNNQPARSPVAATCRACGRKKELQALSKNINPDGTYALSWICMNCREHKSRGRTFAEVQALGKKNYPPIKIFTREQIAEVAHLYSPPNGGGGKPRMVLPDLRR